MKFVYKHAIFILNKTMSIIINTSLRISAVDCYQKINEEGEGEKRRQIILLAFLSAKSVILLENLIHRNPFLEEIIYCFVLNVSPKYLVEIANFEVRKLQEVR